MTTLISGATGQVGSQVVHRLVAHGETPRVFVRDYNRARELFGDRVEVATGDFSDPASLARAMKGVETVFLLTSGADLAAVDARAANVAKTAGVRRLVKLSSLDVAGLVGTGVWHGRGEEAIRSSGLSFSFVRPGGFMSNCLHWARSIVADGVVRSATADGKIAFIHPGDIADVVVRVLTTSDYDGQALPITGPEALSYAHMTAAIGRAIGRPLRYEAISEEVVRRQLSQHEDPRMVEAHLSIYRAIREGRLATVTSNVERVLGRPPVSFDAWAAEHASAFRVAA
jgi:uncharacterized protein YbjT (DUF2867 family)